MYKECGMKKIKVLDAIALVMFILGIAFAVNKAIPIQERQSNIIVEAPPLQQEHPVDISN